MWSAPAMTLTVTNDHAVVAKICDSSPEAATAAAHLRRWAEVQRLAAESAAELRNSA